MGIIWEKADYLIRLLFIIVLGIAWNFFQITHGIKKRQPLAFRYQKDRTGAVVSIAVRVLNNFRKDGAILHIVG